MEEYNIAFGSSTFQGILALWWTCRFVTAAMEPREPEKDDGIFLFQIKNIQGDLQEMLF